MSKIPFLLLAGSLAAGSALAADPALTIYNQDFAVVRDAVPLDLQAGVNQVSFDNTTAQLEPDSVILRDPAGKFALQVLEQNYRHDPVSPELLLWLNEGQTIDFLDKEPNKPDTVIRGRIIRSGYVPNSALPANPYEPTPGQAPAGQPIIEVEGKIRFALPGQPIFPSLGSDTILKPVITWLLNAEAPGKFDAELDYVTGGMNWAASYNVVTPPDSDVLDLVGWVTMDNHSGKTFNNAQIKLMAGEVNKLQDENGSRPRGAVFSMAALRAPAGAPPVTEKAFDEYHLYTLARPTTLHDGESKQVEFIRAAGVPSHKIYVYDGLKVDWSRWGGWNMENIRRNEEFGTSSDTKVAVMREFKNSAENHLGLPLPKGRVRIYKQDGDQLEFIGENNIDHTPKDETVRIFTGNAFDLVGERQRTAFKVSNADDWADESFAIKLRNHKSEAVEIRIVEHLYRWTNWDVSGNSDPFVKTNAQEVEFRVQVKPDEEKKVTYKVHYSW